MILILHDLLSGEAALGSGQRQQRERFLELLIHNVGFQHVNDEGNGLLPDEWYAVSIR